MKTFSAMVLGVVLLEGALGKERSSFVLHEWGTFTTVSGADGVLLPGLQREEEHLPRFVYSHVGLENGGTSNPVEKIFAGKKPFPEFAMPGQFNRLAMYKGWSRPLENVTVKMETPVIYFYSDREQKVDLRVGFHGGAISQWFPQRTEGEIPPAIDTARMKESGRIDFAKKYEGWIRWKVDLLPRSTVDPVKLFHGGLTPTWLHPRVSNSSIVRNEEGEHEEYLFYRGVGNFEIPVRFSIDDSESLRVRNDSPHDVPFAFVFENTGGKIRYAVIKDGVAKESEVVVPEEEMTEISDAWKTPWKEEVYLPLRDGLIATGLYPEEADGMVQTWWKSYFETPGLRVFWVVPPSFTEAVLPMEVKPAPQESVRVLVGRAEVLRPRFEQRLLTAFTGTTDEDKNWAKNFSHDRFGLAYQERVKRMQAVARK